MSPVTLVIFVLGLVFLILGSDWLVRGASRLASAVGVSPLVVGLTVVALGTSSPELAISIQSSYAGQSEMAMGNVVGSNILNVLFIMGISALISPLSVPQKIVRFDVPLLIGLSLLLCFFAIDQNINRWEGGLLTIGGVTYIIYCVVESRRESKAVQEEYAEEYEKPLPEEKGPLFLLTQGGWVVVGLVLLIVGANWMVDGAVAFARYFKVSELVIGLTVVAVGTSLPEIATTLAANIKGERDIAVGNLIGSNIFNIFAVLGLTTLVAPTGVSAPPQTLTFDLPVMVAVSVACLPVFFNGGRISRWEGFIFLGYYIAYTIYLILAASNNVGLSVYRNALLFFAIPLTVIALIAITTRNVRQMQQDRIGKG
jgi:cation:H+ antiporter